jgi:hypothetical protein
MTPQELLNEWNESLEARHQMVLQAAAGKISHIDVIENDIAKLQWFMGKLLIDNVMVHKLFVAHEKVKHDQPL